MRNAKTCAREAKTGLATSGCRSDSTNGFSKKLANHGAAIALHYMHYNLCRIHKTLRVTPAMEAGLTDHVWSIEEIAGLLDAVQKPTKRGPYKKVSMKNQEQCVKVRLIKPNGKIAFTQDFKTGSEAALRYARLVVACVKDRHTLDRGRRNPTVDSGVVLHTAKIKARTHLTSCLLSRTIR
jgi:hypothetical protein